MDGLPGVLPVLTSDLEELAHCIIEVLERRSYYIRLAKTGCEQIKCRYNIAVCAAEHLDLYRVLDRRS